MSQNQEIHILRARLIKTIKKSHQTVQPHTVAFAVRILGTSIIPDLGIRLTTETENSTYGGFPEVACIGYKIGCDDVINPNLEFRFVEGIKRLTERQTESLTAFVADDLAVLGVADGLAKLKSTRNSADIGQCKRWLIQLIDSIPEQKIWTLRARELAGDLLDERGRLRTSPTLELESAGPLEISLRHVWEKQFTQSETLPITTYKKIFSNLLKQKPPDAGELEKAAIWLNAIDLLVDQTSNALFPKNDGERKALELLTQIKTHFDAKAETQAKHNIWIVFTIVVLIWCLIGLLIYSLTWAVMEPWTFIIGIVSSLGGYFYFAITQQEISPKNIYEQLIQSKKRKLYKEAGFDLDIYNDLVIRKPFFE